MTDADGAAAVRCRPEDVAAVWRISLTGNERERAVLLGRAAAQG